jgi:hypothetical protein
VTEIAKPTRFDIERVLADVRTMQRVLGPQDPLIAYEMGMAVDIARQFRGYCSEADAIEWGRAILTAGSCLTGMYAELKGKVREENLAPVLLNLLGFIGADLMDAGS